MRAVIQRVSRAAVRVNGETVGSIAHGFLILLGIEEADGPEDVTWLCGKIHAMRIFSDDEGKMNASLVDVGGSALVVSQFTLHALTKKGNRPSFIRAARPEHAIPLYEAFVAEMSKVVPVETGQFGAMMDVELINDGPVTLLIDSKNKE
jgi:D-tyrosyl-tRNA(Tyr) deacylase